MKKTVSLILALCMVFALCACGATAAPELSAVADSVASAVGGTDSMAKVDAVYIENQLGVAQDAYAEAVVMTTNVGTSIDEYGIFKCADAKAAAAVEESVRAYIQQRIDTWMGYTPEELPKLENASVSAEGAYVMYAIMGDDLKTAALDAFSASFKG